MTITSRSLNNKGEKFASSQRAASSSDPRPLPLKYTAVQRGGRTGSYKGVAVAEVYSRNYMILANIAVTELTAVRLVAAMKLRIALLVSLLTPRIMIFAVQNTVKPCLEI